MGNNSIFSCKFARHKIIAIKHKGLIYKTKRIYNMKKNILLVALLVGFSSIFAQVRIPDGNFSFELPKGWKYLSTTKVDNKTKVYLYSHPEIVDGKDTILPYLKIYVQSQYNSKNAMDMSLDRFMQHPFQRLEEYTEGLFLPNNDAIAFLGVDRDEKDGTENQFYIVYFVHKNTAVEFRIQTTMSTFPELKDEFEEVLKSIVVY
jgi:hypothetical protein